ncbi:hypothetical protein B0T26DRAFT_745781 [Lasiosphaeria miniovina]|uniref:Uncharacterized protein n=1 Tax=Lasiosphaeria miniovina TaxID=1954250 RepID=A0AA40BGY7_9PEZI|nr:uncharacterized protein B0T26DRAFT_745781 [Lasiosphaeria miniovina]KAK0733778.1 hypothetical protein B0T26DRAFT_745781 [Lasiosphaeria miniovina]
MVGETIGEAADIPTDHDHDESDWLLGYDSDSGPSEDGDSTQSDSSSSDSQRTLIPSSTVSSNQTSRARRRRGRHYQAYPATYGARHVTGRGRGGGPHSLIKRCLAAAALVALSVLLSVGIACWLLFQPPDRCDCPLPPATPTTPDSQQRTVT